MGKPEGRGFIGPLGDDIPAIFPIIAGILIFITALAFIDQQRAERDRYLHVRSATLRMSYILTERGYMSEEQFVDKCTNLVKPFAAGNAINFTVILKKYCGPIRYREDENLKILRISDEVYDQVCSSDESIETTTPQDRGADVEPIEVPSQNSVILSYPMAVDCGEGTRGLGMLIVGGWEPRIVRRS